MNKKIDLEDIVKKEFADERLSAFSHDVDDKQKEYLTEEISAMIIDLKRIISKNAAVYKKIADIKPILFDDVFSMLEDMNKEYEEESLTLDYSNFHKKLLTVPTVSDKALEYIDSDGKKVNLYEGGKIECVRNIIIEVLYGKRDNGNNSYRIKTYSSFYAYYLLKNNDLVLADNLSFDKHNKLAVISNEMYGIITRSAKYSSDITRQKILFSYLAERGTGLNFKFLLYKYAQLFFSELSDHGFEKNVVDSMIKDYIYYFTMFRTICMFPDDEFFIKVHKIVSFLLKRRMELVKNGTDFHICEEQTEKILEELFSYQTEEIRNSKEQSRDIFSFFEFKTPKDRTAQHLKLWKEVQYFVNMHIKSDYTTNYFDICSNNTIEAYKALVAFDITLRIRSLEI